MCYAYQQDTVRFHLTPFHGNGLLAFSLCSYVSLAPTPSPLQSWWWYKTRLAHGKYIRITLNASRTLSGIDDRTLCMVFSEQLCIAFDRKITTFYNLSGFLFICRCACETCMCCNFILNNEKFQTIFNNNDLTLCSFARYILTLFIHLINWFPNNSRKMCSFGFAGNRCQKPYNIFI